LAEEIEEAWTQARATLADRRFIKIGADDSIVIDNTVAALISAWAFPEASFIATFIPGTSDILDNSLMEVRTFHLTRDLGVEQAIIAGSDLQLTSLDGAQTIYRRLVSFFRLTQQRAAPTTNIRLSERQLMQVRQQATGASIQAASVILKEFGLDDVTADLFADTLAHPIANSSLVALARRTTAWQVTGLGLLEGRYGLWRLRSFAHNDENWIEVIPCEAAQARREIWRVMNRVLPYLLPTLPEE